MKRRRRDVAVAVMDTTVTVTPVTPPPADTAANNDACMAYARLLYAAVPAAGTAKKPAMVCVACTVVTAAFVGATVGEPGRATGTRDGSATGTPTKGTPAGAAPVQAVDPAVNAYRPAEHGKHAVPPAVAL